MNGTEVSDGQPFSALMNTVGPNETVTFSVLRDGETQEIEVTLGEAEIDFSECSLQPQLP